MDGIGVMITVKIMLICLYTLRTKCNRTNVNSDLIPFATVVIMVYKKQKNNDLKINDDFMRVLITIEKSLT